MPVSLENPKNEGLGAMSSLYGPNATGLHHHVSQGETRKVLAHVIANVSPHAKQDALAFMVAGSVLVRFAEITGDNWTIDGGDDLGQGNVTGRTGENVAATYPPLRSNESHTLQA